METLESSLLPSDLLGMRWERTGQRGVALGSLHETPRDTWRKQGEHLQQRWSKPTEHQPPHPSWSSSLVFILPRPGNRNLSCLEEGSTSHPY